MTIGDRIKQRREELGISVEEVARRLGKHRATVYRYESNEIGTLPTDVLEPLAVVLGTTPAALMGWTDNPNDRTAPASSIPRSLPDNITPLDPMEQIPLIGSIACGAPILAEQNIIDLVDLPKHINATFALQCKGDSMIGAGIHDGDIVYIREQPDVENGQIAAVMVGEEEATLKRVRKDNDMVTLWPENPAYSPMVFVGEDVKKLRIIGRAVAFTTIVR